MNKMDANEIISFISNSKKSTPVKVYVKGDLEGMDFGPALKTFITGNTGVVFGEWSEVEEQSRQREQKSRIMLLKMIVVTLPFLYWT